MRLWLKLASVLLLSSPLLGQSTTVSATVIDTSGQTWNNGTYAITFIPTPGKPGPYFWNGTPYTGQTFSGTLSAFGAFSVSIPDNTFITPAGTQWRFTVCPQASFQCHVIVTAVNGASMSLTSAISSNNPPIQFNPTPTAYGYSDAETLPIPGVGQQYFNVTSKQPEYWDGTTWQDFPTGGSFVQTGPLASQTITQPANTNLNVFTSGTGQFNYNGNQVATVNQITPVGTAVLLNPAGNQTVDQLSGTTLAISSVNGVLNPTIPPYNTGADIGAWINAAYAALPSSGGVISVPPSATGYSFTTPIVFATAGKPAILSCGVESGFNTSGALKYTATTGTAITFNLVGTGQHQKGFGIRDCSLVGPGGSATATGVSVGGTNGGEGLLIENSSIGQFGTDLIFTSNSFLTLVKNTWLGMPATGGVCLNETSSANTGEEMTFENITFDGCGVGGVVFGGAGLAWNCDSCSWDDSQLVVQSGQGLIRGPHFEDPGGTHFTFVNVQGGWLQMIGPTFATDTNCTSSCPVAPITQSSGSIVISGLTFFSNYNYAAFVDISGDANFSQLEPMAIAGLANTSIPIPGTTTGVWIYDNSFNAAQRSILSNTAIRYQGPGVTSTGDPFSRWGTTLLPNVSVGSNTPTGGIAMTASPDATNSLTSKVKQLSEGFASPCLAFASGVQFFTTNTSSAPGSADASTATATIRCDGALSFGGGSFISSSNTVATAGSPTVNQAACIKAAGPPVVIGYCSTAVSGSGACTCN